MLKTLADWSFDRDERVNPLADGEPADLMELTIKDFLRGVRSGICLLMLRHF
jgi:hypothetical protein